MKRHLGALLVIAATMALFPLHAGAQAFTAPQGFGSVTLAWQYVDNTGHRFSDGLLLKIGPSVSISALLEVDYGVTDRFSVAAGVPYVFAKYTGEMPPFSGLPRDICACWHSAFQDLTLSARYRFGDDTWAITPLARYVRPTHDYPFAGEAVVGRNLEETQIGISAGWKLPGPLRKASLQTGYLYSFVEKPLRDVSINRSNGFFDLGYALTDRWFVHGIATWQRTHGGLRIGSPSGRPFFPPGELNTRERFAQRDRVLSTQYWQVGGGVAYSTGPIDLFATYTKYVWGRNAHDGQVFTLGSTWYFDASR